MHLPRRRFLIASLALLGAAPALAQPDTSDGVAVYIVPLDDFPEDLAAHVAKVLGPQMSARIEAVMRLPPLSLPTLPGAGQTNGVQLIERAAAASSTLREAGPAYRVFLTMRDLNAPSGEYRYQFSMHLPDVNCSVVSMARLMEAGDEGGITGLAVERLLKLTARAIGQGHLGWTRVNDRQDLMHAPLMSVTDIDRLGVRHLEPGEADGTGALAARMMNELRYLVEDNRRVAGLVGVLAMSGVMRAAASKPDAEVAGNWVVMRHGRQMRGYAGAGFPVMAGLVLYKPELLLHDWALAAALTCLLLASAWLMLDVFGSTMRHNEKTLELRRLLRPTITVQLDGDVVVESDAPVFTVRDSSSAIRFRTDYRAGALVLINYLHEREREREAAVA